MSDGHVPTKAQSLANVICTATELRLIGIYAEQSRRLRSLLALALDTLEHSDLDGAAMALLHLDPTTRSSGSRGQIRSRDELVDN